MGHRDHRVRPGLVAVAALAGVRFSVVSGGLLCVVGVLGCALLLPGLRAFDLERVRG